MCLYYGRTLDIQDKLVFGSGEAYESYYQHHCYCHRAAQGRSLPAPFPSRYKVPELDDAVIKGIEIDDRETDIFREHGEEQANRTRHEGEEEASTEEIDGEVLDTPGEHGGKDNGHDKHGKKGVEYAPQVAQKTPAVLELDVPRHKLEKQFPVFEKSTQTA
jgi:hypothetical protein